MPSTDTPLPVRERILATASELFYRQGYRATGVNQVIAESGVAKASFYGHFPSKDDLLVAYLRETAERDLAELRDAAAGTTARERFFGPLRMLVPWFEASDYRGCPFQNIAAEAPPSDERVRAVVKAHRQNVRALLRGLAADLIDEEPGSAAPDPAELADTYLLLLEGAIALAVAYRDAWPVEQAIATLEACVAGD